MKFIDVIVGNSSSGILEAPSLKVPTLNIGSRQDGRLRARSIIDSGYGFKEIQIKLKRLINLKRKKIYMQIHTIMVIVLKKLLR